MPVDLNWIMGIAVMFGLATIFTFATSKDVETFFIFLTIFSAFVVWSGLLPLWVLIVCLIIITLIISNNIRKRRM